MLIQRHIDAFSLTSLFTRKTFREPCLNAPKEIELPREAMLAEFEKQCAQALPHSLRELLLPLLLEVSTSPYLLADSLGMWRIGEEAFWIPRFIFQRTQKVKRRIKLGIFAGIHGDEPEAVLGLVDLVRALNRWPEIAREYQLWIYPLCNPSGFVDRTRHSRGGVDLNREFWRDSHQPEIRLLEQEIRRQKFEGIISLHTDDTSDGVYGFVRSGTITERLLDPALEMAQHRLPRCQSKVIDGFEATNGIVRTCYEGVLSASPEQDPKPFEIVLETPQRAPLRLQRQAFVVAVATILGHYRQLISPAQAT